MPDVSLAVIADAARHKVPRRSLNFCVVKPVPVMRYANVETRVYGEIREASERPARLFVETVAMIRSCLCLQTPIVSTDIGRKTMRLTTPAIVVREVLEVLDCP